MTKGVLINAGRLDYENNRLNLAALDAALGELVKRGMALVDDGDPSGSERLYWIPCVSPQMTS